MAANIIKWWSLFGEKKCTFLKLSFQRTRSRSRSIGDIFSLFWNFVNIVLITFVLIIFVLITFVLILSVLIIFVLIIFVLVIFVLIIFVLIIFVLIIFVLIIFVLIISVLIIFVLIIFVLILFVLIIFVLIIFVLVISMQVVNICWSYFADVLITFNDILASHTQCNGLGKLEGQARSLKLQQFRQGTTTNYQVISISWWKDMFLFV